MKTTNSKVTHYVVRNSTGDASKMDAQEEYTKNDNSRDYNNAHSHIPGLSC
jgi:hypothetical protein